jgi:hypothetical protein
MTKSATAPFHCGVHAIRPPQALPSSARSPSCSSTSTAEEPSGPERWKLRLIKTCSASDLVRDWRADIMASHSTAVESRKIQEKNRHFRKHRYDVRIVKAEARGPTRSVFSGRPGDVKRSPNAASRSAAVGLSASERAGCERGETKRPVKLLKTNDLAKRRNFAANDSNPLRPAMRNLSFRHAKDSIRFRGVLGSSRPEAQSPSTIPIPAPPAPDHRRFEKLDRKKLRNGAAKALESLARVNLCGPDAPV